MANYDLLGNVLLIKFRNEDKISLKDKKKIAEKLLKEKKSVRTVLEKAEKFSGRLRTIKTRYLAGEKTKEALYRENNCEFRLNVETCYFSSRLGNERLEITKNMKKNENVLVMFGGVAPFAIVMAKNGNLGKKGKIVSVELGRECNKYAVENVKRNKLDGKVEIIGGDVRKVIGSEKKVNDKFDRIVMARPNLKDSFLDVAFSCIKKKGMIHYYGFYNVEDAEEKDLLRKMILEEAKNARRKIKIIDMKRAGDIAPGKFRYRVDLKVLN